MESGTVRIFSRGGRLVRLGERSLFHSFGLLPEKIASISKSLITIQRRCVSPSFLLGVYLDSTAPRSVGELVYVQCIRDNRPCVTNCCTPNVLFTCTNNTNIIHMSENASFRTSKENMLSTRAVSNYIVQM